MIYFAYGPEMARERMAELCADAQPRQPARIPHHRVTFTGRSESWGGGLVTITLAVGRDLWGALYEVDEECRARIEAFGDEMSYVWCWTQVLGSKDERVRTGVLVKVGELEETAPSPKYLEALKAAWQEWQLDPRGLSRPGAGEGSGP